jgi:hypothetical protein
MGTYLQQCIYLYSPRYFFCKSLDINISSGLDFIFIFLRAPGWSESIRWTEVVRWSKSAGCRLPRTTRRDHGTAFTGKGNIAEIGHLFENLLPLTSQRPQRSKRILQPPFILSNMSTLATLLKVGLCSDWLVRIQEAVSGHIYDEEG